MTHNANTPNHAFDELTPKQREDVGRLVARMIRSGLLSMAEYSRVSNQFAQAILDSPDVSMAEIFKKIQADVSAQAALDTAPMSWFETIAAKALSTKLAPEREQLELAQNRLKQMTPRNQQKINDAINARVRNEKGLNSSNLGPISRGIAKDNILVALMNDDAAIDEILTGPSRQAEGRWPR